MRKLEYLSYSGLSLWESRPEEFYLQRLCERRSPREPQEHPAAVGSAFDAYVKASLYEALFGKADPKYTFDALFAAQVEPQNRDWALEAGRYVFDCYKLAGFYDEFLKQLEKSSEPPRFEFEVRATLNGVPFLGKPDARFVTRASIRVIHDWKVSGFCSKSTVSPAKSYMLCRDGYISDKPSKSHNTEHREYLAYQHGDLIINTTYLEAAKAEWADQLSLYGWAMGEPIGDENVVLSVHQIVRNSVLLNTERESSRVTSTSWRSDSNAAGTRLAAVIFFPT